MNDATTITTQSLKRARWIIDGMAVMRSIKPNIGSYEEWSNTLSISYISCS